VTRYRCISREQFLDQPHETIEKKDVGLRLRDVLRLKLKELGIGIPTLARHTGISRQTLSNWIGGQKPHNIEQVKKVADYLAITVDELCFGSKVEKGAGRSVLETYGDEINAGIFEVVLRRARPGAKANGDKR
jgi:transcriptional regulator with XRE-family HTH domain